MLDTDNKVAFIQATSNTTTTKLLLVAVMTAEAESDVITNVRRYVGRLESNVLSRIDNLRRRRLITTLCRRSVEGVEEYTTCFEALCAM